MVSAIQKRFTEFSSNRIILISIISFILLMLVITAQISYTILTYDKIYKGVFIDEYPVGGLSQEELSNTLKRDYQDKISDLSLALEANNASETINYSEIRLKYDIQNTVEQAFSIGRNGNVITRIKEIINSARNGIKVNIPYSYDKTKVENIVESLHAKTLVSVKEADLLIQDDKVTIRSGNKGQNIDMNNAIKEIDENIRKAKGGTLKIPIVFVSPSKIDIEDYYGRIQSNVKDASFKVENNKVIIIKEAAGRSIDKSALAAIIHELQNTVNTERILPVIFTKPQITVDTVNAKLFKDTLSTAYTQFYTGTENDANRGENIRIASSKINGKILAPGDVFSFNGVVGPRTAEGGFKVAHAYSDGRVVDDVGGGICQVSTTLYNAVLYSDLDVNERVNHMFTVGYVPKGRDAAVSYDSADLKFTNSTQWPIKIESWVTNDNKIYFSLKGTKENLGKTVELTSEVVKTLDFQTKYTDDPTQPEGTMETKSEGMTGYIVDTYKIIKQDGKVVSESKIHRSTYNPLSREVIRGTKKN